MKTQVDSVNQDHLSIPLLAVKLQQGKTFKDKVYFDYDYKTLYTLI